jgi:ABC-type transport system involved in cytochrome bd biosynthesis fused ATPase/permease subunit
MRFYDPTEGRLLLDGVDYREARLSDVRAHMALVGQDTLLLPASIAANIGYGRPGASRREIVEAAHLALEARSLSRENERRSDGTLLPPLRAISRCLSGDIDANPRLPVFTGMVVSSK